MYLKKTAYSQMKIETLIISLSPTRSNDMASFKDIVIFLFERCVF